MRSTLVGKLVLLLTVQLSLGIKVSLKPVPQKQEVSTTQEVPLHIRQSWNKQAVSTTKEVPLYIRQSWNKVLLPIRTACIVESGVNPTMAYRSVMETAIVNNDPLKAFYKCIAVKLNLIEQTTGEFIEEEFLRQLEGMTSEIFRKCNAETKNERDLSVKAFKMYMCNVHALAVPKSSFP